MMDDWREMDEAPRETPVLVCSVDCDIQVAKQIQVDKKWIWVRYPKLYTHNFAYDAVEKPRAWRPLPYPPKDLWERKLAADVLQKQVDELRK